jgi:mono/diheme cytochrome c family protein
MRYRLASKESLKSMKMIPVFLTLTMGCALAAGDAAVGKAVYEKSCKACHGADGTANPAIAKMMKVDIKSLSSADAQGMSDAEIKAIITEGKGKMKPVKTVAAGEVDSVIAYVRTLKK